MNAEYEAEKECTDSLRQQQATAIKSHKIIEMTLDSDDFETIVHVQREQLMFKKQPIFLNRGFEKQKKTCFYVFFLFYVFFIR